MWLNNLKPCGGKVEKPPAILRKISEAHLRQTVEALAYPRHYVAQRTANERARDCVREQLLALEYEATLQGEYDNVIARNALAREQPAVLLGAHYDTVPATPGADDNNSAIAVCLEAARVLRDVDVPLIIAVFNREEDGLLGSYEFVASLGEAIHQQVREAHIFEMVGYFTDEPKSQFKPKYLPVPVPSVGNFLGMISNSNSNRIVDRLFKAARRNGTDLPLIALKNYFGFERVFRDLLRSDHAPFWEAKVPAIMWTDTANFRNPNYHQPSDTPETLNYAAMAEVVKLVVGGLVEGE